MDKDIRDALAGSQEALLRYLDKAWASYQKRQKAKKRKAKKRKAEAKPESPLASLEARIRRDRAVEAAFDDEAKPESPA